MKGWMVLALLLWAGLLAYTAVVIGDHGLGLLPVFFGDIAKAGWPGQFNLDFLLMLFTSASWTAWRNRYRPAGLTLAVIAFFAGSAFLLPYLAWLIQRHRGDMAAVLLGTDHSRTTLS